MKINAYSIFDTAAGAYARPFFTATDSLASRAFCDIASDANHEVGKHPDDYILFKVGLFDDNTGEIHPFTPEKVISGVEALSLTRNQGIQNLKLFEESVNDNANGQ